MFSRSKCLTSLTLTFMQRAFQSTSRSYIVIFAIIRMTFLTLLRLKHVFVCCRHGRVWWTAAMATRSTQWMTKKVLDHHQGASLVCLNSLISFSFNTWNIMFVYTLFDWHCHIFNWFIDWCQTKFKQTGPLWSILDGPVWQEYKIRQMWQAKGNPVINKQVAENFYKLIHWYTIPYISLILWYPSYRIAKFWFSTWRLLYHILVG